MLRQKSLVGHTALHNHRVISDLTKELSPTGAMIRPGVYDFCEVITFFEKERTRRYAILWRYCSHGLEAKSVKFIGVVPVRRQIGGTTLLFIARASDCYG